MGTAGIGKRVAITLALGLSAALAPAAPALAVDDNYACTFNGSVTFDPAIPLSSTQSNPAQGDYSFSGTGVCEQSDVDWLTETFPINNSGTFEIDITSEAWYDDSDCQTGSGHGHGHGTRPVSNTPALTSIVKDVTGTSTPAIAGDELISTDIEYEADYTLGGQGTLDITKGSDLDGSANPVTNVGTFSLVGTGSSNCVTGAFSNATVVGSFDIDVG